MKIIIIFLFLHFFIIANQVIAQDCKQLYTIAANVLNARKAPSTSASIIGRFKKGDIFCAQKVEDRWVQTDKGWVSENHIVQNKGITNHTANCKNSKVALEKARQKYTFDAYYKFLTKFRHCENASEARQLQKELFFKNRGD